MQEKTSAKPAAVAGAAAVHEKPVQKPVPAKPAVVNEYWIQVASFTSISHAEDVLDQLKEKGLSPVITSKTVKEDTYYRVRIGPYANKDEAEKFLAWIKKLDAYTESYISLVPRQS